MKMFFFRLDALFKFEWACLVILDDSKPKKEIVSHLQVLVTYKC